MCSPRIGKSQPEETRLMKRNVGLALMLFSAVLVKQSTVKLMAGPGQTPVLPPVEAQRALKDQYCVGCHNDKLKSGGFSWTQLDVAHPEQNADLAEKVIRKLRAGMMPPAGARRPDLATTKAFAAALEKRIDEAAAAHPYVGAPELHRINRTEYHNSVHDLLGLDEDVTELLPPDARTNGFDNMSDALTITPALMSAYV